MREIKFRAWDKKTKEMIIPNKGDEMFFFTNSGELLRDTPDIFDFTPEKNWIPMQYTGLKDRLGKEIYEGDIITYHVLGIDKEGKYVNDFTGFIIFRDGRFDIQFNKTKLSTLYHYLGAASKIKIIGNIYENPELLK